MKFLSLQPFVPSGAQYEQAKAFFQELGFTLTWDMGDYAGFKNDNCRFILQRYNNKTFAENFMLSVGVEDVAAFREEVLAKQLPEKYGIRVSDIIQQPYGKEVNVIDMAGVCWHFVQQ
jgi:hypothetical protein